jgi:hypothetical protein
MSENDCVLGRADDSQTGSEQAVIRVGRDAGYALDGVRVVLLLHPQRHPCFPNGVDGSVRHRHAKLCPPCLDDKLPLMDAAGPGLDPETAGRDMAHRRRHRHGERRLALLELEAPQPAFTEAGARVETPGGVPLVWRLKEHESGGRCVNRASELAEVIAGALVSEDLRGRHHVCGASREQRLEPVRPVRDRLPVHFDHISKREPRVLRRGANEDDLGSKAPFRARQRLQDTR